MKIKKSIISVLSLAAALALNMSVAYAWFIEVNSIRNNELKAASITNYFAGGSGTVSDPYLLNDPKHVYNLSWLQSRGEFQSATAYFSLLCDINMAGNLNGLQNYTGAVPPVGNETYPFTGVFDGNGHTISNIWVSSAPEDWYESPSDNSLNVGQWVGFFGKTDGSSNVSNLYLENIEVTSHVMDSSVGLIAGYANASMNSIGVKNGKISLADGGSYKSECSLIGEIGPDVNWTDKPASDTGDGGNGGELIVDPTGSSFSSITLGNFQSVPNSLLDTAYFSGALTSSAVSGGIGASYKYNISVSGSGGDKVVSPSGTEFTKITSSNYSEYVLPEYWERINDYRTPPKCILPAASPDFNNLTKVNDSLSIPANCIWFKPEQYGKCGIAFTKTNNSNDYEYMSVYRFKRTEAGGVDVSALTEVIFGMSKRVFKNKDIACFEFLITEEEVMEGYEYAIGKSSLAGASTAGFYYLILAGTNVTGGEGGGEGDGSNKTLSNIDYVDSLTAFEDESYKVHNVLLSFSVTSSSGASIYYNIPDSQIGKVCYAYTGKNVTMEDKITNAPESLNTDYTAETYPERVKISDE